MRRSRLSALPKGAYRIRRHACAWARCKGQGYIAQALGVADILAVAYCHACTSGPEIPSGKAATVSCCRTATIAIALYAALIEAGIVPEDELETYGSDDSRLPMSGMASYTPGMEISGGSLGQGLASQSAMASAEAQAVEVRSSTLMYPTANSTRADVGSRDVGEPLGSSTTSSRWSTSTTAGRRPLDEGAGLRAAGRQVGRSAGTSSASTATTCDASDRFRQGARAASSKPHVIICDTKMGKGVPFLETAREEPLHRVEQPTSGSRQSTCSTPHMRQGATMSTVANKPRLRRRR